MEAMVPESAPSRAGKHAFLRAQILLENQKKKPASLGYPPSVFNKKTLLSKEKKLGKIREKGMMQVTFFTGSSRHIKTGS